MCRQPCNVEYNNPRKKNQARNFLRSGQNRYAWYMLSDSHNLFSERAQLRLPERTGTFGKLDGNLLKTIISPEQIVDVSCEPLPKGGGFSCQCADGFRFAVVPRDTTSLHRCDAVLKVADASSMQAITIELEAGRGKWILPRPKRPSTAAPGEQICNLRTTTSSWIDAFQIREELYEGDVLVHAGLRPPQVGAIYAAKAHWSVSSKPATIVLPTGTGKTETMLSLLVSERLERLLVIVPTDQLRTQVAEKFITLGVLKQCGCLTSAARHPTVVLLRRTPTTSEEVERLASSAHVIVSTMQVLAGMRSALQERLAQFVSHLFVDEAHHIGARTWRAFKLHFGTKPVLQFTATPFRNDGRRVDGKFIYVYPLRQAQKDRLFKPIRYVPIHGMSEDDTDDQMINAVGVQLKADLTAGFSHVVMARTRSVERATELHQRYKERLPEYAPQLIHSRMRAVEKARALKELREARSRIIVCVDMLGEGFDLPDLKIAALHDKHRSEAVTLQFIGRFTRARQDLGDATVIANVSVDEVSERLRALYAEDADWNHILSVTGQARTERERRREDVYAGFTEASEEFPLETFEPRLSTVVYRTHCAEWRPEGLPDAIGQNSTIVEGPFLNAEARILICVTRDEERIRWTSVRSPRNVEYNMVMAHWDADQSLLFINSSRLNDLHLDLAKRLAGEQVERISGEQVFRVLYGFRRMVLMNLGLSETQRKPVRYSMFMGSDIAEQLETLPGNRTRTITNLFGQGFTDIEDLDDNGNVLGTWPRKGTIGCSTKGKIWSYQVTNSFAEWVEWCRSLGKRLLNESITNETILRNVVRPSRLQTLPTDKTPIAIAWPERFLYDSEDRIEIGINGRRSPFFNCEIEITEFAINEAIRFRVYDDQSSAQYEMRIAAGATSYAQTAGRDVVVHRGQRETRLVDIFREDPPHIYFADGDLLVDAELFVLRREEAIRAYDLAKIEALDWSAIDIRTESQGKQRRTDSIQYAVIQRLRGSGTVYDIMFDDDGPGEVADVVAIRRAGQTLNIELYFCKYSSASAPGARVRDLYEVCGQAQKSVRWAERLDEFLRHLRRREAERRKHHETTRFDLGDFPLLLSLLSQWRELKPVFSVTIVQPGYSKAAAVVPHLELFAATESYLMDTWRMPLRVWASP